MVLIVFFAVAKDGQARSMGFAIWCSFTACFTAPVYLTENSARNSRCIAVVCRRALEPIRNHFALQTVFEENPEPKSPAHPRHRSSAYNSVLAYTTKTKS